MSLVDVIVQSVVLISGLAGNPFVVILIGAFGAYLGKLAVENIPVTRRFIERREAAAREGGG
ncbi:hypothetical protein [Thermostaphylospora chromogena]|uniref:Uncharacterized protein n=1 Tax=Thermostaphylospora chromogena TaxID=35622 RepID=A0A1H1EBP3_9ACTN|nr:hypothetical protein [Thermostaphylospora chromogena]SDQ85938.1 hypothetical protein SAMN04489764_2397 [Thermostaphylospora chromogena]